jgi:trans-aconitate methyltransferase
MRANREGRRAAKGIEGIMIVGPPARGSSRERQAAWNPELYDAKHSFVWQYGAELISLLAPKPGERIMDLGSGTGHLASRMAESGASVVGVDRSQEMVDAARRAYPGLDFRVGDARDLPFRQEFDAVFSNATLHWIQHPEPVIAGVWNALRPGGRFVGECGGKGNIQRLRDAFESAREALGMQGGKPVDPWFFPSISQYAALLENQGFEVRSMSLFDRLTPLEDGEGGLRNWISAFAPDFYSQCGPEQRERFLRAVEQRLRTELFREGRWFADYRRLRFAAWK